MDWTRTHNRQTDGTRVVTFDTENALVVVRRITWKKPGFRNVTSAGWIIEVNGEQYGAAHGTATKAMRWAELPGIWADIQAQLAQAQARVAS